MKPRRKATAAGMRSEYDFDYATAIRGKYYPHVTREGACVVVLDPDVARAFRSSAAVNEALRSLLEVSEATRRLTEDRGRRPRAARRRRATTQRRTVQR